MNSLRKGSITVFLAFLLSLSTALICTELTSVKLAASRAQISGAMDIGLYSLFAQYDKSLLDEYELFYLDGGFGSSELHMGKAYDILTDYMEPVLQQNFTELELERGGWSGYELATDEGGASFYRQASEAAKLLLESQGISLLLSKVEEQAGEMQRQEAVQESQRKEEVLAQYEKEIEKGAESSLEGENTGVQDFQNENVPIPVISPQENPIEVIKRIQKMGILELVLENPSQVSEKEADKGSFVSLRSRNQGMPMSREGGEMHAGQDLLFQEYLLQKCGNYRSPGKGSLAYQTEYILFGRDSDLENLKKTVNRLLLLREGANLMHLYTDPVKGSQASAWAAGIASALLLPMAEPVIRLAILSCWAFGESILDVRELMAGGKIALVKDSESWQLSIEKLPHLLECLDSERKDQEKGLSYEDYLRVLLFLRGKEEKISRGMDMVECGMRAMEGKENFRLDCCIAAAEVSVDVKAGVYKTYTAVRAYTYECA